MFGGIPATGAIARTATNIRSGAVSPVSGVVQSIFVLGFLLLFAPYASYIPLAAMAPILMFVAWNMSARKIIYAYFIDSIRRFYRFINHFSSDDFRQLNGCSSSWYFNCRTSFLRKMSGNKLHFKVAKVSEVEIIKFSSGDPSTLKKYIIDGPLFFGTAKIFEDNYPVILTDDVKSIILDMEHPLSSMQLVRRYYQHLIDDARKENITIIIKRLPKNKITLFKKSGLYEKIGEENFFM